MLKIKDNYDLNNLKKYGFKHEKSVTAVSYWDYWELELEHCEYYIETKNRIIDITTESEFGVNLDILYNMIQDGIVGKESEA